MNEYIVINTKTHEEQRVITDSMDGAIVCAAVLNRWCIDDLIATEEEYLENDKCCALTPYGE